MLGNIQKINTGNSKVDDVELGYSYRGQIGGRKNSGIEVYQASVPLKDVMKLYKHNGVTLYIYKRSYATAALKAALNHWREKGWLS